MKRCSSTGLDAATAKAVRAAGAAGFLVIYFISEFQDFLFN
jgi:hypothetical protein